MAKSGSYFASFCSLCKEGFYVWIQMWCGCTRNIKLSHHITSWFHSTVKFNSKPCWRPKRQKTSSGVRIIKLSSFAKCLKCFYIYPSPSVKDISYIGMVNWTGSLFHHQSLGVKLRDAHIDFHHSCDEVKTLPRIVEPLVWLRYIKK